MNRQAAAALVLEVTAGVAAQTSGIGGLDVTIGAAATFVATSAYLVIDAKRLPLSERIRHFAADRHATEPPLADTSARDEHKLDAIECFEEQFGADVRAALRRLRKGGELGRREERRLGSPDSLVAIEDLADRLHELGL